MRYLWKRFGYSFYTGIRCEDEHSLSLKSVRYERVESSETEKSEFSLSNETFESVYVKAAEDIIRQGLQTISDP